MRSISLWCLASFSLVSGIELAPRSENPRVVGVDIQKRTVPDIVAHDRRRLARLLRRQNVVEQTLDNEEALYFANITLGTPPQALQGHIDTGSSDLWVNVANSTLCSARTAPCIGGTYDPSSSSSYKFVNSNFNVTYVDGSNALGNYVNDTLVFGGTTLQNFQFGVGETSNSYQGVLGIGYAANEVQVQTAGGQTYPNLPQALLNAGHINRNAYSLWLNDLDASTGSILFGGVNKAKYQGTLETVPVYQLGGGYYQFVIAMTNFSLNGSSITSNNLPAAVVLDSGSTLSRLPDDIVEVIYDQLQIQYDSSEGVGLGYCDLANTNAYLEFGFSGINIQVPFNELFIEATTSNGQPLTFSNGREACIFGIAPSLGIIPILGDTFLRSAYVVYDLQLNQVSLAQTIYNSTTDDIVEIASGTAAIPGASPAPSTVGNLASGTATDGARIGTPTGSYTAANTAPSSASKVEGSGTITAGASSTQTSNVAYPTKVPSYVAGAALIVGAGLFL